MTTPHITPELDCLFEALLGSEKQQVYEQIGCKLPHHIRFNPLKGEVAAQIRLFREQGFEFVPTEEHPDIYRVEYQPYPIGKSLSHFLGHFYVQDVASMVPAMVLDPQPREWVLDMAAAPGSKTTLMGEMMNNRGVILANDVVPKRLKALGNNLERMSICNTTVYRWRAEQFGNAFFETFDRVLLDPACSGLGTLHKNPEVIGWWNPGHSERLASQQRSLLISAVKALKPGGRLVYSTCTVAPQENEANIDFLLREFPVEIEPISLPNLRTWPGLTQYAGQTFHPDLAKTVRFYPVDRITEGFYIACLRKTDSVKDPDPRRRKQPRHVSYLDYKTSPVKKHIDFLMTHFQIPEKVFKRYVFTMKKNVYFTSREMADFPVFGPAQQTGLPLARPMDRGCKLNSGGAHLLGQHARRMIVDLPDLPTLEKFVNREPLDIPAVLPGQYIVQYNGCVIGYGVADHGRLKSQFPKGEWPFRLVDEAVKTE